jgi:RHS repeat-associated protein
LTPFSFDPFSFDAWGKKAILDETMMIDTLQVIATPLSLVEVLDITPRGFTGHEHVDHADIIHMNGRIYDPLLGRFMQADPIIQAPKNSQNYNRYSYVINNPLSLTDPSGFSFIDKLLRPGKNIVRSIFRALGPQLSSIAVSIGSYFCGPYYASCVAMGNYDIARAFGTNQSGALRGAFTAGVTAYVFQQIGQNFKGVSDSNLAGLDRLRADGFGLIADVGEANLINFGGNMLTGSQIAQQIAAHAIVGGVSAELQGGKFGHGFFAAGVTKGAGGAFLPGGGNLSTGQVIRGTVISAVVGGTASVISGGKFGELTAAWRDLGKEPKSAYFR